jgi:hypothetical protein
MSRKQKAPMAPVPPGNRSPAGPSTDAKPKTPEPMPDGAPFSEQDPQRRLGNYATKGEHAIEQPGGKQGSKRETSAKGRK